MRHWFKSALAITACLSCVAARADVIITLNPYESEGVLLRGSVEPGSRVSVDVLLSVDEGTNLLANVRAIILNVIGTDQAVALERFTWSFDSVPDSGLYTLRNELPAPTAEYNRINRTDDRILDLTAIPVRVATIEITVNDSGVLSVVGTDGASGSTAEVRADFREPQEFTLENNNLLGGTIAFFVEGDQAPSNENGNTNGNGNDNSGDGGGQVPPPAEDTDGDGVNDDDDAFPDDAGETTDTDGDGIGDNADSDDDGDGVADTSDAFPLNPRETVDSDGDGVGDNSDMFPTDPTRSADPTNNGNLGPKVTGTLCGPGLLGMFMVIQGGLYAMRRSRRC